MSGSPDSADVEAPLVHPFGGLPGTRLAELLRRRTQLAGGVGPFAPLVARVSGPSGLLAEAAAGLPAGAAQPEAVVARLRARGLEVAWGEPVAVPTLAALVDRCRARGASSVELVRADPTLVPLLQVGSWFQASWRLRLARRATARVPSRLAALAAVRVLELVLENAFWAGVRAAATEAEWRLLARSSYVAFYYHRISGEASEERLDVPPARFEAQLRLLRRLRFRALSPAELLSFHGEPAAPLPRRSYVLTADDGFLDAARAFSRAPQHRPQLFVVTDAVGERAPWPWGDGARLASWSDLAEAAGKGVAVGSHTRTHPLLPELAPDRLEAELVGSLVELERWLPEPLRVLAYPHGRHDAAVRAAAAAAGYRAAYTTEPGRNGAGTDPFRLRRIGVKAWDSRLSFLWKAATGEPLPRTWERWRRFRYRRRLASSSARA
jgi:peptidoglycan/xylan/chitin deacetylase (PgdA/CDA1 family)